MSLVSRRLFACLLVAVIAAFLASPGATAPTSSGASEEDFISFSGTLTPSQNFFQELPDGKIMVVTDLVLQNIAASGLAPVLDDQYSAVFFRSSPSDAALHVVGNETVNLHFSTGLRTQSTSFQIQNGGASSAPVLLYIVSGYVIKRPAGF